MLATYIKNAMKKAHYEILEESKTYYGKIKAKGFDGVWAEGKTLEECREELEEVLEEWIFLRISRNLPIPKINGIKLIIKSEQITA